MAYKQSESGLLLPAVYNNDVSVQEYSEDRRLSMPFNQQRQTYYNRIHPDASGSLRNTRVSSKKLINKPIKEVIRILVKAASSMSDAFDLHRQFINAGHRWETESTRDERILRDMEDRVTVGGGSFQTIIDKFVYAMVIEGAFCGEITGNKVVGITDISAVSPFEITFTQEEDPKLKVVDIIGQGIGKNFVTLQDPRRPNPYFIYDPISADTTEPWGIIPFLPGITAELMYAELFTKIDQYLDGQIFPKGYFSFDLAQLNRAELDPKTIIKWVNESVTSLRQGISSSDVTQSVVTKVPTLWTLVGSVGRVNLDGLEMFDRIITRTLQRSYNVPPFMYDLGGTGSSIQSSRERTQMLIWLRRMRAYQRKGNEGFTQWGNIELEIHGSRNRCEFVLDDTDLEGERIIAERDQLQADARHTQAQADQIYVQAGVVSREEVRATVINSDERFSDLNPTEIPELPPPQQQQFVPFSETHACDNPNHHHGQHTHITTDYAATLSPDGSDQPLAMLPMTYEVTPEDFDSAVDFWNGNLDRAYRGLLLAQVTDVQQTDVLDVETSNWVWSLANESYSNDGVVVDKDAQIELRDSYTDQMNQVLVDIADGLENGRKSVQQWLLEMRSAVRDVMLSQFLFGKGGHNAVYEDDLVFLSGYLLSQWAFLQAFAESVHDAAMTIKQIQARARLYSESSTRVYSESRARAFRISLPNYPADGSMECNIRCRCHWRLEKDGETQYKAYWMLDPLAQHCPTCSRYSTEYNPYIAKIGE